MKKKLLIILGASILGIYVLFLLAPLVLNPIVNGYVSTIKDEIKKATGLESNIENIKFVTTPKLTAGIKVEKFELKDLMSADNFQAKMSLLPLLARKIEVDVVSLENLDVKLGVNKDGSFAGIEIPETEQPATTEPMVLPFGLRLSNHLPDIRVGGYNVEIKDLPTGKSYVIKGDKTAVTDFILDKSIKVLAKGSMTLADREQFTYNVKINNKIMPELNLHDLVFNPQPKEEVKCKEPVQFNIIDIFKGLYDYKITANADVDLTLIKDHSTGYIKVDNISVIDLPPSDIELKLKNKKIDINSILYTAKNEKSTLCGILAKNKIDMCFKSNVEINNIIKIINALAMTFNIDDLQTLTANGKLDADFNIKSNMKKVNSNGYLKIPSAKLRYGLYDVNIDNINADVLLDNNNINIKNIGFSVLNQPLKFCGTISEDAKADLHLLAQNLNLRELIVAAGQGALLKENAIGGQVNLKADIVGKLDKINPTATAGVNNLTIKNIPANIAISVPKAQANINQDTIEITQTPVKVEKINFNVSGTIKNYLTEKIALNFVTTGDIKSTLTGDMNAVKQILNLVFNAQNSTIVVPMFDKSKMTFNSNIGISGNMMNPILSGVVNVPNLNIPEIPVTMENLTAKLNGAILHGNATVAKFTSGGIAAQDITSGFSLKGENFYLTDLKGTAFDGKIWGNIIYNLANAKTTIDFAGDGMNAEKAIHGAAGIKNALSGTLGFNTKLTLVVADYNDMMRSMKGNLNFKVTNGAFGTIGRIENFFGAGNIASNTLLKSTTAALSNLAGIKNTAKFDYIEGDMTFNNGWADIKSIKSTGATLAYFVKGKYNLINGTTNVTVLGRLDSTVVALLGPIGDLSADKLLSAIPKFGALTASIVNNMTTDPKGENIAAIPALSGTSTGHKDFKVMFNGGLESTSSIKSFKWLTKVDTSALQTTSAVETLKSLKDTVNEDFSNTVKGVSEAITNNKDALKTTITDFKKLLQK